MQLYTTLLLGLLVAVLPLFLDVVLDVDIDRGPPSRIVVISTPATTELGVVVGNLSSTPQSNPEVRLNVGLSTVPVFGVAPDRILHIDDAAFAAARRTPVCVRHAVGTRTFGVPNINAHILDPATGMGISELACERIMGVYGAYVSQDPARISASCDTTIDFSGITCIYDSTDLDLPTVGARYAVSTCLTWSQLQTAGVLINCTGACTETPAVPESRLAAELVVAGSGARPSSPGASVDTVLDINITLSASVDTGSEVVDGTPTGVDVVLGMTFNVSEDEVGLADSFLAVHRLGGFLPDKPIVLRNHYRFDSSIRRVLAFSIRPAVNFSDVELRLYNLFDSDTVVIDSLYARVCTTACPCVHTVFAVSPVPVPDYCTRTAGPIFSTSVSVTAGGVVVPVFANTTLDDGGANKTLIELDWTTDSVVDDAGYIMSAGNLLLSERVALTQGFMLLVDHSLATAPVVRISALHAAGVRFVRVGLVFYAGSATCFLPEHAPQSVLIAGVGDVAGGARADQTTVAVRYATSADAAYLCPPYSLLHARLSPIGSEEPVDLLYTYGGESAFELAAPWAWNQTYYSADEWSVQADTLTDDSGFDADKNAIICADPWPSSLAVTGAAAVTALGASASSCSNCTVCPQVKATTPYLCNITRIATPSQTGTMTCTFRLPGATAPIDLYTPIHLDAATDMYYANTSANASASYVMNRQTSVIELGANMSLAEFEIDYVLLVRDCFYEWHEMNWRSQAPQSEMWYREITPDCVSATTLEGSPQMHLTPSNTSTHTCETITVELSSECPWDATNMQEYIYNGYDETVFGERGHSLAEFALVSDLITVPSNAIALNLDFTVQTLGVFDQAVTTSPRNWALSKFIATLSPTPAQTLLYQLGESTAELQSFVADNIEASKNRALACHDSAGLGSILRYLFVSNTCEGPYGKAGTPYMAVGEHVRCSIPRLDTVRSGQVYLYAGRLVPLTDDIVLHSNVKVVDFTSTAGDGFLRMTVTGGWVREGDTMYKPCLPEWATCTDVTA